MPAWILPAAMAVASGGSAAQGFGAQNAANKANKQAQRQIEMEWNMRAPLRLQGMQALGQIEAPMDVGEGARNLANPFSRPVPSTQASGNWGQFTTSPDTMQMAAAGLRPDELAFMNEALAANYIGRSGGKQRYAATPGGREFTNDDRKHAQMLQDRYNSNVGFTGITPQQMQQRMQGIQPMGTGAPRVNRQVRGYEPLGG